MKSMMVLMEHHVLLNIAEQWKVSTPLYLRRRIKVVRPSLFTFLGHLQRTTEEVGRLGRGMLISRAKKRANLISRMTRQ